MQVSKWGDSLAVRLPDSVVEALDLKEGDQVEIRVVGDHEVEIARAREVEEILSRIDELSRPLPPGYKFDRLEANQH
jgi:antitoxin MazE